MAKAHRPPTFKLPKFDLEIDRPQQWGRFFVVCSQNFKPNYVIRPFNKAGGLPHSSPAAAGKTANQS